MKKREPPVKTGSRAERGSSTAPAYRFSGHETFPCRYSWLPKAFAELTRNPELFANEELAMVRLGVGRNMVKAIRFWVQASGIAASGNRGLEPTEFGTQLLTEPEGFDPYLEDIRTLWLIHWKIASNAREPLFAWEFLLNRWQHPEITRSEVMSAFVQEAGRMERKLSLVTLEQHFDTFLHTYIPTRNAKGDVREDNLDSPLVELDLIRRIGEKRTEENGRTESVYAFNRESKHAITPELFVFCVDDYWRSRFPNEETLSFRDLAVNVGSIGQLFKLPESDIRDRLQTIHTDSKGAFSYRESSALSQLERDPTTPIKPLSLVFETEVTYA